MSKTWLARAALITALSSVATAQNDAPSVPLISSDPVLVAQLDGPGLFQQKLLPTDVGSMLATKDADAFWSLVQKPLLGMVQIAGDGAEDEMDGALALVQGYRGRITLAIELIGKKQDGFAGMLAFAPDGKTDLGALGALLGRAITRAGFHERKVMVGEREFACMTYADGAGVCTPVQSDGHLVLAFGAPIDAALSHYFSAGRNASYRPDAELAECAFGMRVNLVAVVSSMREEIRGWLTQPSVDDVFTDLGFDSLRELRIGVKPAGASIQVETSIQLAKLDEEEERGMFGGLMPAVVNAPKLGAHVPPGFPSWQIVKQDWDEFVRAILDVAEGSFPLRQWSFDHFNAHLDRDLLAHLGDEVLLIGDFLDGDDRAGTGGMLSLFEVSDAKAFDAGLDALSKGEFEIFCERPKEVHGVDVHVVDNGARDHVAHARFGKWFVYAYGPKAGEWTERMVAHLRVPDADAKADGLAALNRLKRHAPPGFNGYGQVEVGAVSNVVLEILSWELPSEVRSVFRPTTKEFRKLLRENGLTRARAFTGLDCDRWRVRVLW